VHCFFFSADGTAGTKPPAKRKKEPATSKQPQNATSPSTVSDTQSGALSDGGHGSDGERKRKKARTTFTGRQIFELEKQFEVKKDLSSSERAEMAKLLNVTETQVRTEPSIFTGNWNKQQQIFKMSVAGLIHNNLCILRGKNKTVALCAG
jgi:hypothetical protein